MSVGYYLDDDIGMKPVIAGVRRLGIEINPSDDFGMRGADDSAHLEFAAVRNLVVVTANLGDFLYLHRRWLAEGRGHSGLVVVRQRLSIGDQIRGLAAIDALFTPAEIAGEALFLAEWLPRP